MVSNIYFLLLGYVTIIPLVHFGYEMVTSQRNAQCRVEYHQSRIEQASDEIIVNYSITLNLERLDIWSFFQLRAMYFHVK